MDKEILTTAIYKENCEYQTSEVTQKVLLPQQDVTIKLTVEPPSADAFFYNDNITLSAIVFQKTASHPIQVGRIEFYYIPDKQANPILINRPKSSNEQTCKLNKYGSASVIFRPNSSCKVFAKYIDDNEFYVSQNSEMQHIVLKDMPVTLNFTKTPPYITNVHDSIELEVQVTDVNENPVQYGTVTFMRYLDYNDIENPNKRVPKIIGNPVPVDENGRASIKYLPVQTDDYLASEIEQLIDSGGNKHFVEYVRASYNYMGRYNELDEYTESYCNNCYTINYNADTKCSECGSTSMTYWTDYKWKYYSTDSEWTGINVCARNSITINPLTLPTDGDTNVYKCSENDKITVTAKLLDKDGNPITFKDHQGTLTFYINGAHAHPNTLYTRQHMASYTEPYEKMMTDFSFNDTSFEQEATFDSATNCFTAQLPKLLPGYYTIQAKTSMQIDTLTTDYDNIPPNVEDDKYYAEVNDSNILYITSQYTDVNYNITTNHDTRYAQTKSIINNLIGNVTGLSNKQMEILNNAPCHFYIHELNTTYTGKLSYDGNNLTGSPIEDIQIDIPGDYYISMSIPIGVYTNNISNHENNTYDFYLPAPTNSTSVMIQIRDNPEIFLSINSVGNITPGFLDYHLSGKYLNDDLNVKIMARLDDESSEHEIDNATLNKYITHIDKRVNIDMIGSIICYAQAGDIKSGEITFDINKDIITQEVLSNNIYAQINSSIGVYIHTQANNINNIGTINNDTNSNILAFIYDENMENKIRIEIDINSKRIIDSNTIYFNVKPEIYTEGTWYLQIQHIGNNIIQKTECEPTKITTYLYEPHVSIYPYDNNYYIKVTGDNGAIKNNIVVATAIFLKHNNIIGKGILITDTKGIGSFYDEVNNQDTISWWNDWNNVNLSFNPFDTELINIIKNSDNCRNSLTTKYENVFDYHHYTDDATLRLQVIANGDYIFNGYKEHQVRLPRPNTL